MRDRKIPRSAPAPASSGSDDWAARGMLHGRLGSYIYKYLETCIVASMTRASESASEATELVGTNGRGTSGRNLETKAARRARYVCTLIKIARYLCTLIIMLRYVCNLIIIARYVCTLIIIARYVCTLIIIARYVCTLIKIARYLCTLIIMPRYVCTLIIIAGAGGTKGLGICVPYLYAWRGSCRRASSRAAAMPRALPSNRGHRPS